MMVVVSTGFNAPTKDRCLESVEAQTCPLRHIYVEAGLQDPPRLAVQNAYEAIHTLDKNDIVAMLDGDDWLSHPEALAYVQSLYNKDPDLWLTYGSFVFSDGRPGFAAPYPHGNFRQHPWLATHLKTFRAGLFQKIKKEDLQVNGEWQRLVWDTAIMYPMLEMAGPDRILFIEDILYVYNLASSFEWNASSAELALERKMDQLTRARPPYGKVKEL